MASGTELRVWLVTTVHITTADPIHHLSSIALGVELSPHAVILRKHSIP